MPFTFSAPHWVTALIACVGAVAGAAIPFYPQYAPLLGPLASFCALLAAPGIHKTPVSQ